ncbi:hypothetical protein [Pseudogemmobacter sonorensis]|uniref:hypothetical protein n=1 Tax=Pseudogemmobacter sonorensis TaxID=2989681 RepID=UPI0036A7474B
MTGFTLTLWLMLPLAWLLSGERFLDWAYGMPDLGPVDDILLSLLDGADRLRVSSGLGDVFGALRARLHGWTGLGGM